MKATDYKMSAARHVLVYGGPKTGKTELVGSLLKCYRLWWFSFDQGVKTLFRKGSIAEPYLHNLEIFPIPDTQLYPMAIETMLKVLKLGRHEICHMHGKVACADKDCKLEGAFSVYDNTQLDNKKDIVVFDHYSQIMDSVMNRIFKDFLKDDKFDEIQSTFHHWAQQGAMSDRIGSTFQNCNYNVIVLSHEVLSEFEDGTKRITPVGGTRNKSADFARYFDDVVYTEIVGGQFKAHATAADKTRTIVGNRSGKSLATSNPKEQVTLLPLFI